ncbi:MAG: hypothetical protein E7145_02005 [Rikenellaceae bacterium]|nr:hypothetical protein [Rikenellaceae bacterium]
MKRVVFTLLGLMMALAVTAQENNGKLQNVELMDLKKQPTMLPWWGEKHLLIFYVDPDRHKQNEDFTVEIEENHAAEGENIEGFGVLNLKDTMLPSGIVRTMARKRTEKNGATVLADTDRTLAKAWGLGDCNNQFVLMLVSKDGEMLFLRKGELTEEDKAEFYRVVKLYR